MKIATVETGKGTDLESALAYATPRAREHMLVGMDELRIDGDSGELVYGDGRYTMTGRAAERLAGRLGINPRYALKIPNDLAATNFNTFLETAQGHAQMCVEVRPDGEHVVTGFLREGTMPVEPIQLIEALGDRLNDNLRLHTWTSNDAGLIFRTGWQSMAVEPRVGDIVYGGADVTLYEDEDVALSTRGILLRLICTNGATTPIMSSVRRSVRRDMGADPAARIQTALDAGEDAAQIAHGASENLRRMTTMELADMPVEFEDRVGYVGLACRAIASRPIRGTANIEAVAEAISTEERTLYGLYNAITRIGRDAVWDRRRERYESAGLCLAVDPDPVAAALLEFDSED